MQISINLRGSDWMYRLNPPPEIATIALWAIEGSYHGDSEGGDIRIWALTHSMSEPPDPNQAIAQLSHGQHSFYEIFSIRLVGSTEAPYGFHHIDKHANEENWVSDMTGYDLSQPVSQCLKRAILLKTNRELV